MKLAVPLLSLWCARSGSAWTAGSPAKRTWRAEAGSSRSFSPVAESGYVNIYGRDITDRKRAEEALRESEERFRGTFENAAVGIIHNDSAGRFLRVNERYCAIVGRPRAELLQKAFHRITHPDDLPNNVALFTAMMRGESAGYTLEKRCLRKDGSPVWVELFSSLQRDAAGRPAYAIGVVQDI